MKKKVLALFTAIFMVLSLAGCNTQGLSLVNELEKTSTWEAIEQSGTMNMTMTAGGEEVKFAATYEAFSNVKDVQIEMTVTPKEVEVAGTKVDLTQGDYKFSPVKIYMDGLKMYISSSYIKDVCRLAGVDASTMVDVSKDYMALDLAEGMEASGMDLQSLMNTDQANYDIYKNLKVELPIKQDGRKYTIDLTGDQMVDTLFGLVIESFNSQEATIKATYKAMGMTDEQIDEVLAQVKAVYNEDTKAQIKPFVKDSKAQVTFDFADDKYTTNYDLDLKVNALGEKITMNIKLSDAVKKATKKTITFPTSVKTYTMNDLMSLAMGSNAVTVNKANVVVQGNKQYVPVKSTLASVGIDKITFDAKTKTVTIDGTNYSIPVIVKNGTSYASVESLQNLGVAIEIVG